MKLNNFIFFSTLFSIFTEAMRIVMGFDLKFFYLVVFINLAIFIALKKVVYTNGLLIFHLIILSTGIFSIIIGYNEFGYFIVQFFFLLIIPIYYYSFFDFFKNKFSTIIIYYCKFCFILAIIGILKMPEELMIGHTLHSILLEPAHYCTIILPAFFITLRDKQFPRYYNVTLLITIFMSDSSLGFLGLALSMFLYAKKISFTKTILAGIIVLFLGNIVYSNSKSFQLRMDDTIQSFDGDLSKSNLSTYALLSNFFVSYNSFITNPILGNGIGSHIKSRELYLGNIIGIEIFEEMGMEHLNAQDAGSLFSRLMSEMGLVGIIGVFYFIKKFYVPSQSEILSFNTIVSRAILLYFFAKLFREGHYFSPEMYFFVFAYVFNKYDYINSKKAIFLNA